MAVLSLKVRWQFLQRKSLYPREVFLASWVVAGDEQWGQLRQFISIPYRDGSILRKDNR